MSRLDIRHLSVAAWAIVNMVLCVVIGQETGWGRHIHKAPPVAKVLAPDEVKLELLTEYNLPAMDKQYPQTLERPLFVPTRRPAPPIPPPPPPPKPTMKKGQFQLMGVMIFPENSYVLLREVANGKTYRLKRGQMVNGILLKEVAREKVVLTQYDEAEELIMKVQSSPKTPPPALLQAKPPASTRMNGTIDPLTLSPPRQRNKGEQSDSDSKPRALRPVMNIPGFSGAVTGTTEGREARRAGRFGP